MAEELGLDINETEFEEAQAASKEASKASQKKQGGTILKLDVHDIAALEKDSSIPKTNDSAKFCKFRSAHLQPLRDLIIH
jgi:alanyl-tRNA synthetase